MIKLYSQEEFDNARSSDKLALKCEHCGKAFLTKKSYIVHELKNNRGRCKYCSQECNNAHQRVPTIKVHCEECGKEIKLTNKEYNRSTTKHFFCSHTCSAKYNNRGRYVSLETRIKIAEALRLSNTPDEKLERRIRNVTYFDPNKEYFCLNCGAKINNAKSNRENKFCCHQCQTEYKRKDYITRWKNGEETGIRGKYGLSRIIREYLLEKAGWSCSKCGWHEINPSTGKVPLQIHHIDGDCLNNKEENLQVLCPNCHSLTENFGSKNVSCTRNKEGYPDISRDRRFKKFIENYINKEKS